MARFNCFLCLLLCAIASLLPIAKCLRLPEYITPCKADKDLDACALKHGQAAIEKFINGDPKYRLPKLDPMLIPRLSVNQGNNQVGLNLTLLDCYIHGLGKAQFVGSRMDLKKMHVEWDLFLPRIELLGDYKSRGKILILPITGDGPGNITLLNMKITYKFDYRLEKRKGEEYLTLTTSKLTFNTTRMYIKMDNLFNGDKLLGNAMLRFLDENWREVVSELGPSVGDAIGTVFRLIISNIATLVPYKHIFILDA